MVCENGGRLRVWIGSRELAESEASAFVERVVQKAADRLRVDAPRLTAETRLFILSPGDLLCLADRNEFSAKTYAICPACSERRLLRGLFGEPFSVSDLINRKKVA
jgi:hypothetical protein